MLKSLLADGGAEQYIMLAIVAVLIVVIVVFYVFSNKKRKKQEQDAQELINAVKPGNKVKTIGGICGIVVEVDNEENTFVLETGTEKSGKSYIKFDRQAIYQTDAVVEKKDAKEAEQPKEEQNAPAEAASEAPAEVPAKTEETPAEEVPTVSSEIKEAETPAQEKPKKSNKSSSK